MRQRPSEISELDSIPPPKPLPLLTVLCPIFNEEKTVPLFFDRIKPVFEQLKNRYRFNLIFLDNCSSDNTLTVVKSFCEKHSYIFSISLTRNVGYQRSIECGFRNAEGDLFLVIDVDCEDPPEMIPDFLRYHEEGFDIIYGERVDRVENPVLKLGRKLFYRFTQSIADEPFILDMAEFCLLTREVRDSIIQETNSFPFIRANIGRVGFRLKRIPYKRQLRIAGKTHYNFYRMAVFALAGVLTASTFPLRLVAYILPFWALVLLLLSIIQAVSPSAWVLPTMLLFGFSFLGYAVASMSLYLARVYKNGLQRPNYFIDAKRSNLQRI